MNDFLAAVIPGQNDEFEQPPFGIESEPEFTLRVLIVDRGYKLWPCGGVDAVS